MSSLFQQACVHPSKANCSLPQYITIAADAATGFQTEPPSSCPEYGLTLIPHEYDCHKYYKCINGTSFLMTCYGDDYFSAISLSCVHNSKAYCNLQEYSTTVELSESTTTESIVTTITQTTKIHSFTSCPADFSITTYLPHDSYCNKYYQCVFGAKVEKSCGLGTHFNYELQICDHIANVNCQLPGVVVDEVKDYIENNTTVTETPIAFAENGCPVDQSIHWLLPHEDDCTKFYNCVWGSKVQANCYPGLHFNAKIQICDYPSAASCQIKQ